MIEICWGNVPGQYSFKVDVVFWRPPVYFTILVMDTPSAGERLALTSRKKPQSSAFLLQFIQTRLGLIYYRCTKYETMIAVCGWIFPHPIQHPIQPRHLPANSGAKLPNIVTAPPPLAPSHKPFQQPTTSLFFCPLSLCIYRNPTNPN